MHTQSAGPFQLGIAGANTCPTGSTKFTSLVACTAAFGVGAGTFTGSFSSAPSGCYLVLSNNKVAWNKHPTGGLSDSNKRPICALAAAAGRRLQRRLGGAGSPAPTSHLFTYPRAGFVTKCASLPAITSGTVVKLVMSGCPDGASGGSASINVGYDADVAKSGCVLLLTAAAYMPYSSVRVQDRPFSRATSMPPGGVAHRNCLRTKASTS